MTTHTAGPIHNWFGPTDLAGHPGVQAYWALRIGFIAAPIIAGIDKFAHALTNWDKYLAPQVDRALGGHGHEFMLVAGVIEIIAGIGVAILPRIFGYVVCAWLCGIILNLLIGQQGYLDIALRDLGLALAAFAMARLADMYARRP
jgi:uncharacterized membrane protein YphA (DoxX/SURF4 family)